MNQQTEIKVGDLLFISQGIWVKSEKNERFIKRIEKPCLGTVVEMKEMSYKICIGDEIFLLDEDDAHKYVRENGD